MYEIEILIVKNFYNKVIDMCVEPSDALSKRKNDRFVRSSLVFGGKLIEHLEWQEQ